MRGAGMVACTKEREKTWPLTVGVETATHKNLGPIQLAHFWVSATLTSTVSEDGSIRLWYRTSSLNPNEEVEVVMEMEAKFEAKPNQKHIHKVIERKLVGTNEEGPILVVPPEVVNGIMATNDGKIDLLLSVKILTPCQFIVKRTEAWDSTMQQREGIPINIEEPDPEIYQLISKDGECFPVGKGTFAASSGMFSLMLNHANKETANRAVVFPEIGNEALRIIAGFFSPRAEFLLQLSSATLQTITEILHFSEIWGVEALFFLASLELPRVVGFYSLHDNSNQLFLLIPNIKNYVLDELKIIQ